MLKFCHRVCSKKIVWPNLQSYIKLSDSQVALHWINSICQPLRQWVRNKVIDINRLSERSTWRDVRSKDMIADIGTRKGAKISDIDDKSDWVNGYPWMWLHALEFPVKTIEELVLDNKIVENVNREMLHKKNLDLASGEKEDNLTFHISEYIGDELENRLQ